MSERDLPRLTWWQVLLGGLLFAAGTYAVLWALIVLAWAVG